MRQFLSGRGVVFRPYVCGTGNRPRNYTYGKSGCSGRFRLQSARPLAVVYPKAMIISAITLGKDPR
jgi:hypothetical protein